MDDFEFILGKEFLRRTWLVIMPFVDKLVILGGWKTCVVCTTIWNPYGRVCIVSTFSMKRETKCMES